MTDQEFLRLAALIIAAGGAFEVFRRYVFAPLVRGLRSIAKALNDLAALVAWRTDVDERFDHIDESVGAVREDVSEIKGALKAAGILPDDGK